MGNRMFIGLCIAGLLALIITYSNHFENAFHFDDSHTIINNIYIRDLSNIPLFFKDATTFSSLPSNQSYRPMMTASLAFDYWLADGLNKPFYFHLTSFIWYVFQCILMYFILIKIFQQAFAHNWNRLFALLGVIFYALHTANAETINYISAHSDSLSTFWLTASFSLFLYFPRLRNFGIYLIPLIIGLLVKPAILVFPGILFFYLLFFEDLKLIEKPSFNILFSKSLASLLKSLPSLAACIGFYILQEKMTPETFTSGGLSTFNYMITQPFVWLHYFKTFILPNDLSADTDWSPLQTIWNYRFFAGSAFIAALIYIAYRFFLTIKTRPISFGIIWFFLALLPSSSIVPFAEVLNDHRTFFPYIGLVISFTWVFGLWIIRNEKSIISSKPQRTFIFLCLLVLLTSHAFGAYQRNKVWKNDESLWYDVTIKSPENGRGLMNYGLSQMRIGNYAEAEKYFLKGLEKWPYYSYLYVNMGVLKSITNDAAGAEQNFKQAMQYAPNNPESYHYYSDFLFKQKRYDEAITHLKKALELSPAHISARYLLMQTYADTYNWQKLEAIVQETLKIFPGDARTLEFLSIATNKTTKIDIALEKVKSNPTAENYLQLSLVYYNERLFEDCISACLSAIKINPEYAEAYNNICSANNELGRYDEAEKACRKALAIMPDYTLAQNNLSLALNRKDLTKNAVQTTLSNPTPQGYLDLSLLWYKMGNYEECINAAQKAIKLKPDFAEAYNNICSAYNQLRKWDEAIKAGEMAVKINPDMQLARNNLLWALKQKQENEKIGK